MQREGVKACGCASAPRTHLEELGVVHGAVAVSVVVPHVLLHQVRPQLRVDARLLGAEPCLALAPLPA